MFETKFNIIPDDSSTLFICSGMQNYKQKFINPDGKQLSTLQSCIRTNDLDLVGDGTHLTYFQMLGNFSFNGPDYEYSIELWDAILQDLNIKNDCVIHYHPSRKDHKLLWNKRNYNCIPDEECTWTDGNIGGNCCEVYINDLEIGNLVNTLNHSTDVGFGFERILMILENKQKVHDTSLFNTNLEPVQRDFVRSIDCFYKNNIPPGNKGRNYVCRKLIRRILPIKPEYEWNEWIRQENELKNKCLQVGKKLWRRHKDKSPKWWWESCGILETEIKELS